MCLDLKLIPYQLNREHHETGLVKVLSYLREVTFLELSLSASIDYWQQLLAISHREGWVTSSLVLGKSLIILERCSRI